jgi:hypothetical protein
LVLDLIRRNNWSLKCLRHTSHACINRDKFCPHVSHITLRFIVSTLAWRKH